MDGELHRKHVHGRENALVTKNCIYTFDLWTKGDIQPGNGEKRPKGARQNRIS